MKTLVWEKRQNEMWATGKTKSLICLSGRLLVAMEIL